MRSLIILLAIGCMSVVGKEMLISPSLPTQAHTCVEEVVQTDTLDTLRHIQAYRHLKQRMKGYKAATMPEVAKQPFLYHALTDSIFPYWYGTAWDFNGITETPRKGKIACGYFVSTTLRDLGIPLNRYRLAQKASSEIVQDLCDDKQIHTFRSRQNLLQHLKEKPLNGLFVIGLSYHVGFIVKQGEDLFFIHANYTGDQLTVKEKFEESAALQHSDVFVLGDLLESKSFLDRW
ncbi:MAG: hypothetical protein AAFR59_15960 [Bacteroidota bacterium]